MPTNKHATIRFHALDRCFSNFGRKFYIEDLIEACNDALYEYSGIEDGVKRRQIFDDMTYMESEQGWSVPLERIKDGRRKYYRYDDKSFSIKNQGINQSEAEQLKDTLSILSRFRGMPQFDWIQEMQIRLEDVFKLKNSQQVFVSFQENPFLKGMEYFADLLNAMQNQQALQITYKGFREDAARTFVFHPWHLKQYNNRWFAFGWNENENTLSNLPVDRIIAIEYCGTNYKSNDEIDFDEYFDDVVGVTVRESDPIENIRIKVSKDRWPYIQSKPLHGSQKTKKVAVDFVIIEIAVRVNFELRSLLYSHMDGIEVLEPEWLKEEFRNKLNEFITKYI